MPRVLFFLPCEKLIVDELGNPTLICVMESVDVEVPKDRSIPENAFSSKEWDVVALWYPGPGDEGKKFKQRFEFVSPDGQSLMKSEISFEIGKGSHRNKVHINGFPVGKPGIYQAKLWLDIEGEKPTTDPVATYPIRVVHKTSG